jgi:hypothetical protein
VQVVDTPGLFDTDLRIDNRNIMVELTKSLALVSTKPHAFVFVVSIARITQEELDAFRLVQQTFGNSHLILAFTYGEKLDEDAVTIETAMKDEKNTSLKEMVETVKERYAVFSETTDSRRKKFELKALVENIEQVSKDGPWENKHLAEMAREIEYRIAQKEKEKNLSHEKAIDEVRKEMAVLPQDDENLNKWSKSVKELVAAAIGAVVGGIGGGVLGGPGGAVAGVTAGATVGAARAHFAN